MPAEVHVGDIGTIFVATIVDETSTAVDISSATTKQLWFTKTNGTVVKQTGAFTTSGTDGKLQYTTIANDLDQAGPWSWQAYVVLATGTWHSSIAALNVRGNLSTP